MDSTASRVALVVVVTVSVAAAVAVNALGSLGHGWAALRASGRALVQLLVVALVIAAVLDSRPLMLAFVALMVSVASLTAARRLTQDRSGAWAALPVVAGALPALALVLVTGLVPFEGVAVVPIGGILIGGAMTATVLAGRRSLDALASRRGEYEAALSVGLTSRDAALLVARDDAALALVPGLDQTRTVGLVTLPGAFVGMLLGGASPIDAAAVQLVVLVELLMVQSVAVVVVVELVARGWLGRSVPRVGR
ncbi:ABC transporter permease [Angustibacter sp. McL0619]|uniref:ABC transporter permease n=1 Tax=Angustibacter sp. McL0619 TaxID=3415676 RepID=UPI003CEDE367